MSTRQFRFSLAPHSDVEVGPEGFVSVGVDPSLILQSAGQAFPEGWVELTYESRTPERIRPVFVFDTGDGFTGTHMAFPYQLGEGKGLLRVPAGTRAIRLDPMRSPGAFDIRELTFRGVSKAAVLARALGFFVFGLLRDFRSARPHLKRLVKAALRRERAGLMDNLFLRAGGVPGLGIDYRDWLSYHERATALPRERIERAFASARKPLPRFSVIMPTYNTPLDMLARAVESVRGQSYPNWDLCIADDASPRADVRAALEALAKEDARIKVVFRPQSGHISEASNSALELATGDYVTFLDHDDELARHALERMALEIALHPEARFLYSDEDKIDERGQRFFPHFKPDFDPELLLAQNYICHLAVFDTNLVREVGGLRKGFEGSQDHDLVLRISERLRRDEIRHVPEILYHWRVHASSTAGASDAKPYAVNAGVRAVTEALERRKIPAAVSLGAVNTYRVEFQLPSPPPLVSILIPTRDSVEILRTCIHSLLKKTDYPAFEVLILDNQSRLPETRAFFRSLHTLENVRVLSFDAPFNYSAINNFGARNAKGDLLLLLNNDIEILSETWLSEMVGQALVPDVGAVGAKLYYPDFGIQHAGVVMGFGGIAGHAFRTLPHDVIGYFARSHVPRNVSAVTGACLMTRRDLYERLGGLDEKNLSVAYNDVDYCLRVWRQGLRVVCTPYAELVHHESATRGSDLTPEKRARFERESAYMQERWGDLIADDPFHNPSLSLAQPDCFALSWPPRARTPQVAASADAGSDLPRLDVTRP